MTKKKRIFGQNIRKGEYGLDTSKFDALMDLMRSDNFGNFDFKFKGTTESTPTTLSTTASSGHSTLYRSMFGNGDISVNPSDIVGDYDAATGTYTLNNGLTRSEINHRIWDREFEDLMRRANGYKSIAEEHLANAKIPTANPRDWYNPKIYSDTDNDEAFALTTGFDHSTPESTMASLPLLPSNLISVTSDMPKKRSFGLNGIDTRAWGAYKGDKLAQNYGLTSREDVANFQRRYKLKVDGLMGPESIKKLNELIINNGSDIYWKKDKGEMYYRIANKTSKKNKS